MSWPRLRVRMLRARIEGLSGTPLQTEIDMLSPEYQPALPRRCCRHAAGGQATTVLLPWCAVIEMSCCPSMRGLSSSHHASQAVDCFRRLKSTDEIGRTIALFAAGDTLSETELA